MYTGGLHLQFDLKLQRAILAENAYAYSVEAGPSTRAKQQGKKDEADHDRSHAARPQHRRPRRRRQPPLCPRHHQGGAILAWRPALLGDLLHRRCHQRRRPLLARRRRRSREDGGAPHGQPQGARYEREQKQVGE